MLASAKRKRRLRARKRAIKYIEFLTERGREWDPESFDFRRVFTERVGRSRGDGLSQEAVKVSF
ncbi:MAG: hypothetical protein ABSB26_06975 [Nitrososphaerales archaeon]